MRRTSPGVRALLIGLGVLTGVAGVELALRALDRSPRVGDLRGLHTLRLDRPWLYGLRPGAEGRIESTGPVLYRINADGFRGPVAARPKPEATFRILLLGDSVAFGYGVEEEQGFARLMERSLSRALRDRRAEVVNLGVGGYNPYLELALLRDVGASFAPDLVVAQFCINDLNDPTFHFDNQTRMHLGAIPDAAFPDPAVRRTPARDPPAWLRACRRSRVCARLDEARLAWTAPALSAQEERVALDPIDRVHGPEWDWLEARYADMAQEARRIGAGFAVLAVPFPAQLARPAPDPVQARLREIGERRGWATLDPLPAFRRARRERPREKLFLDGYHPTPAGQRLTARAGLAALACAGLLPPETAPLCSSPDPPRERARVERRGGRRA